MSDETPGAGRLDDGVRIRGADDGDGCGGRSGPVDSPDPDVRPAAPDEGAFGDGEHASGPRSMHADVAHRHRGAVPGRRPGRPAWRSAAGRRRARAGWSS